MLTILEAVAEIEREMIVDRVNEGIEKAKQFGTKSGKPIELAKLLEVSRATLYRNIKEHEG
jgi:DNA invertase Pin-like site-specific DNA recombinase